MCRFVVYQGPPITLSSLITEPSNSLIHQSVHSRERVEPLNGDGFGVAWYCPDLNDTPAVFRSISPAWSNRNLLELAGVTRSGSVFAHVRAATPGMPVVETNCHPFSRGRFVFMHNGRIARFRSLRRRLLKQLSDESFEAIEGSTDSEHIFALFMDRLRDADDDGSAAALENAMQDTIRDVVALARDAGATELTNLNLAVSDGHRAVVSRFTTGPPDGAESLYFQSGTRYACEDGACLVVSESNEGGAVLISSERLSDDSGWQRVPGNHMVVVDTDRNVRVVACVPSE
ncbi:MAG: class II glutamine amidotransferase [Planctomycetota bacterium]|nr:class II glutamine amidotransferase [Planctomycetota bacterium]